MVDHHLFGNHYKINVKLIDAVYKMKYLCVLLLEFIMRTTIIIQNLLVSKVDDNSFQSFEQLPDYKLISLMIEKYEC